MVDTDNLIDRLKDASTRRDAFPELVRIYQKRIYNIVRKMVIRHDDADDLVQETFVKVWNHLDSFKSDASLFTWIYRIATNECLMFLRSKRRRMWFGDLGDELAEILVSEKSLDGDEVQALLQKAILKLPDKQRLVFNMKYYEDLTFEQMSEITGTSVGALKASFHHATKKIEEFLDIH